MQYVVDLKRVQYRAFVNGAVQVQSNLTTNLAIQFTGENVCAIENSAVQLYNSTLQFVGWIAVQETQEMQVQSRVTETPPPGLDLTNCHNPPTYACHHHHHHHRHHHHPHNHHHHNH